MSPSHPPASLTLLLLVVPLALCWVMLPLRGLPSPLMLLLVLLVALALTLGHMVVSCTLMLALVLGGSLPV